ncbi:MAG: hypothetical protein ABIG61_07845 [Planctomycetota bacterium]
MLKQKNLRPIAEIADNISGRRCTLCPAAIVDRRWDLSYIYDITLADFKGVNDGRS